MLEDFGMYLYGGNILEVLKGIELCDFNFCISIDLCLMKLKDIDLVRCILIKQYILDDTRTIHIAALLEVQLHSLPYT